MTTSADDDVAPSAAFAALGDPVRVGIIETLADRDQTEDGPNEPGLPFSTLRKRVGVDDSGRFRYHLEKLRGLFVEQTASGQYYLTYAGGSVASAIVSGTYTQRETIEPTPLDSVCPQCGSDAVGRYENGLLQVDCQNDHRLFYWSLAPNATRESAIEDVVETATRECFHVVDTIRAGNCPGCFSPIDAGIEWLPAHDDQCRFRAVCQDCGNAIDAPVGLSIVMSAPLRTLYFRHDRSIYDTVWWNQEFAQQDCPRPPQSADDGAVTLAIALETETLRVDLSERAQIRSAEYVASE